MSNHFGRYPVIDKNKEQTVTGGEKMQWIRASSYRIKSVNGENFIVPIQKKIRHGSPAVVKEDLIWRGCSTYDVNEVRAEMILNFLNIKGEGDTLEFTKRYGPLGLFWYYTRNENVTPLKIIGKLDQFFGRTKGMQDYLKISKNVGLDAPPMGEGLPWILYREPVWAVLRESERFRDYVDRIIIGESPGITLPAKVVFVGGKPHWVPVAKTLIEYAYAWLPVVLGKVTLKICENKECGRYFTGRGKHCTTACKNAQNQREKRQRETIMRRLGKGMSLEEATAGCDMEKVKAWLEEGLIFLPMRSNYSKEES